MDSCLELCLLLWGDVYMVYGNVKGYLWGIRCFIVGQGLCYQHLLTRAVFDGDIIVLQMEQHSLEADWCICQVLQIDLLEGLVALLTVNVWPTMCRTILNQRYRQTFHTLHWCSTVQQVLWLLRQRQLGEHLGISVVPRPFCEASTWIVMGLWTSKYHRVVSVQTRHLMLSKGSWYDWFHVKFVPSWVLHREVQWRVKVIT